MRTFQAIFGMFALLIVASQTYRHVYVRWIEPRESVLDQFDQTKQDISAAKTIDELLALYRPVREKVREADAKIYEHDGDSKIRYQRELEEPYKSETQLRSAIHEWEDHHRKLVELHFFWWAGFMTVCGGFLTFSLGRRWLGLSAFVLGYLEMIWATCPSFPTFGYPLEFEQLLTFKVCYSMISLILLFVGWRIAAKPIAPHPPAIA